MLVIVEISGGGGVQVLRNGGREWVAGESGSPSDFQWWGKFYVARGGWVAAIHLSESQTSNLYKTPCIKSALIWLTPPHMFDKQWYKRHFKTSCSCICVRNPADLKKKKIAILLYFGTWLLLHKSNKASSALFPVWRLILCQQANQLTSSILVSKLTFCRLIIYFWPELDWNVCRNDHDL